MSNNDLGNQNKHFNGSAIYSISYNSGNDYNSESSLRQSHYSEEACRLLRDSAQPPWPKISRQGLGWAGRRRSNLTLTALQPWLHLPFLLSCRPFWVAQLHTLLAMKTYCFCELLLAFPSKRVAGRIPQKPWFIKGKRPHAHQQAWEPSLCEPSPFQDHQQILRNSAGNMRGSARLAVGQQCGLLGRHRVQIGGFSQPNLWEGFTSTAMFSDSDNWPFCVHTSIYLQNSQFLEYPDPF